MAKRTQLPNRTRGRLIEARADERKGQRPSSALTAKARRKRGLLLDAARAVFEREGFLHARISDICDEAGISHGSFYTYFSSKEEIFHELVDSIKLDVLTPQAVEPGADTFERIKSANRHYLEAVREHAGILAVIEQVVTFDDEARRTRDLREMAFADALERRTRQYQDAGLADPRLDAGFAARALGAMAHAVAVSMFITGYGEQFELDEAAEQLTLLWTNALGIPDNSSEGSPKASDSARI